MGAERYVPIADIRLRSDARPVDPATVAEIKRSICQSEDGEPLHAPVVRVVGDAFELIDGRHRMLAMAELGNREIKVSDVVLDDLHAELMMIDGNLCRAELTGIQRDRQTARRKAIYEELHPETRQGTPGVSRQVGDTGARSENVERFTAATTAITGQSERSIQRSAERGEKIAPAAASLIQGTRLDTGAYAASIKDLPAAKQVEKVRADLVEPRRPPPAATPKPVSAAAPPRASAFNRFIALSDGANGLKAADVIAGLPSPNRRADLRNRVRSLLAFLEDIDERLEGTAR